MLLPAPNERPAVNELSRSGPSSGRGTKALKMKHELPLLAESDSKTGRLDSPKMQAHGCFCLSYVQMEKAR
jgi:hypothetical protein